MREIDCSNLPDELEELALDTAQNVMEENKNDGRVNLNSVEIIRSNGLIYFQNKKNDFLYGMIVQSVLSTVRDELLNEYSREEARKYHDAIEFRD